MKIDLSAEINGIAMIILGLSNQLDNKKIDILGPDSMKEAMFGISRCLERIADDLGEYPESKEGLSK